MRKKKVRKTIRPTKSLSDLRKVLKAYDDFLVSFELVFHCDDEMTYGHFAQGNTLDLEAAIYDPEQFTGDNHANIDSMLASYGRLKELIGERGLHE